MGSTRRRLTERLAAEVMFAVDLRCCLCEGTNGIPPRARNGQIHHLDGNPSNNAIGNLAWLCLEHHEDAGKSGKTSRRISAEVIRRYRAMLQGQLRRQLNHEKRPTAERAVYQAALDANIVAQLWRHSTIEWDDWKQLLLELATYPPHLGHEAKRAILERLDYATARARTGMPGEIAVMISDRTIELLPLRKRHTHSRNREKREDSELLEIGSEIGEALAYDGALHVRDIEVVYAGCEVLWRVHKSARLNSLHEIEKTVTSAFETAMDGAVRSGLPHAADLIRAAQQLGDHEQMRSPQYPSAAIDAIVARSRPRPRLSR